MLAGMDNEATDARIAAIARGNDAFRAAMAFGRPSEREGRVFFSHGVAAMGPEFVSLLALTVAGFADFNADNDPIGDHSFGAVEVCGTRVFWKIDLYDEAYAFGASIPESPEKTRRVLTMLLPSEY